MSPTKVIEWSGAAIVASVAVLLGTGALVIFVEAVKGIFH